MATVTNTIVLRDRMSGVIDRISQRMRELDRQAERTGRSSATGFARMLEGARAARGALNKMGGTIVTLNQGLQLLVATAHGLKNITDTVDEYTQINARLNGILEKGQTLVGLQDKIYESAERSRSSYTDAAKGIAKMAQLGKDAFKNNDEIIKFTETLQKSYVVGGATATEQAAGIYQITQALAANKLQGDEYRSVRETSPLFAQAISDFTGKSMGQLQLMSRKGEITAEIMVGAMKKAADEIDRRFGKMPKTFGQVFQMAADKAMKELQPMFALLSRWLNTGGADLITNSFLRLADAILWCNNEFIWLYNTWDTYEPYLTAILAGVTAGFIQWGIAATIAGIQSAWASRLAIQEALRAASAWAFANLPIAIAIGLIALLIYWWDSLGNIAQAVGVVIVGVMLTIAAATMFGFSAWVLVIAVIALVIGIVLLMGGTFEDIFGFIGGVIGVFVAFFYNRFVDLWNYLAIFVNWIGGMFQDPMYACKKALADMIIFGINKLELLAGVIDKIFGSKLSSTLSGFKDKINEAVGKSEDYHAVMETKEYMQFGDAFDKGSSIGKNIAGSIGDKLKGFTDKMHPKIDPLAPPAPPDYQERKQGPLGTEGDPTNTKLKGDVKITDEDLKYLRDFARVQFINKFTTLRPSVNASFGDVRETADINKIAGALATIIETSTASALA